MISLSMKTLRPDLSSMGPISLTSTVDKWINENSETFNEVRSNLLKFMDGDWGQIDTDDWSMNADTLKKKTPAGRLMASYALSNGETMWIITDGYGMQDNGLDYCYTTILSPDDY